MSYTDILLKVDVGTKDGTNYKMTATDQKTASRMLNKKKYFFFCLNTYLFWRFCYFLFRTFREYERYNLIGKI